MIMTEVTADPVVDLLDTFSILHLLQGYVGVSNDGREGWGDLDSIWKSDGHRVGANALNEACRTLLRLGGIKKGSGSSVEVGSSDHLEQHVPRSPGELLG